MARRQAVAAAAGVAALGLWSPAAWASAANGHGQSSPGSSSDAPAGNNGHIQIDEYQMDGGSGNDPHVGCGFSISFFGYDAGTRTATVTVTPWAPTRGGTAFHSPTLTWDPVQRGGGNQLDYNYPVPASAVQAMFKGVAPAHQGYHARVEVEVDGSQGSDDKYKMVWISPCSNSASGTSAPSASSSARPATAVAASALVRTAGVGSHLASTSASPTSASASSSAVAAGQSGTAGTSVPVAVLGESVSRPLAAAPAGSASPTLGGLPFTGADIALESAVALGLIGSGAFLTRRYRLRRR